MDEDDRRLIQEAQMVAGGGDDWLSRRAFAQLLIKLKDTLIAQNESAAALGTRIENLNRWLLYYTVAMALMAAFQIGGWIYEIAHSR